MNALNSENTNWFYCTGSIEKEKDYPVVVRDQDNLTAISCCFSNIKVNGNRKFDGKRVNLAINYIEKRTLELKNAFEDSEIEITVGNSFNLNGKIENLNIDLFALSHIVLICKRKIDNQVLFIEVIQYSDRNLYINVNDNPEFTACLKSILMMNKVDEVVALRATIIQPGIDTDPIRHQNLTTFGLDPLVDKLVNRANRVIDLEHYLKSGKHCNWCLHKPNCEQITKVKKEEINKMDGGELSIIQSVHTEIESMPLSKLADILDAEKSFNDAFSRAKVEAKRRAELGEIVSNDTHTWFIGNGKKSKSWNESSDKIVKKLKGMKVIKDDIFPSKLITPAQALKLDLTETQINNLKKLISEIDGKPSLMQGENKQLTAEDMFSAVKTEEKQVEEVETSKPMSFI